MPFNNGENVGPYRVIEKLGQGGMATVYKAYHANLDRYVALKVLHPAFLEDKNFLARFQREARLVAKLEHQNIVPIYDFSEHEGQPYLVMKFVEGETLKAYLSRGRLSVEQIWDVVDAVGAGLGYAHQQGILHRDIKPSNVIIASDGQMYLADFGLARIAEMGESTLSGDMIMGTPQYISPEQAMGVKDLDARTDIYSFAVILYEMVVGQVPFSSDTPFSIIHDHIYSPLPLPKSVNPSIPDAVERVLLKALAKERDDRYQSASELMKAFKNAWDEAGVDMAEVTMTKPITEVAAAITPEPQPAPVTPTPTPVPQPVPVDPKPVPSPAQSATRVQAEPVRRAAAISPTPKAPKKKKRKIWLFVLGGIIFLCVCVLFIGALSNWQDDNLKFGTPNVEPGGEIPYSEGEPMPPGQLEEIPDIAELRAWVEETPEDPYAHLALALALFDSKQFDPAYDELRFGLELAGGDIDYYYDAGFNLMAREAWGAAAIVFMRALQHIPADAPERVEFVDLFHECLYKAAAAPEMPKNLPLDELMRMDDAMMLLADARHTFFHGDRAEAWQMLDGVNQVKPGMPEARLLEAEMSLRDGNRDHARELLEALMVDEYTPYWIFFMSEETLNKMP